MQEVVKFILGIAVLILGIPIGNLLAKLTKEELGPRKIWFVMIILLCFAGAILGLILQDDTLLFTLLFIAIVTSRSLKKSRKKEIPVKKSKVKSKKKRK